MLLKGQGATEYLVLLAAVLIIALVSLALLAFFPGTASDAQIAASQAYWKSASPIGISEWIDIGEQGGSCEHSHPYFRLKNNGADTIIINRLFSGNSSITQVMTEGSVLADISSLYRLGPGEEAYIGGHVMSNGSNWYNLPALRMFALTKLPTAVGGCPANPYIGGVKSTCSGDSRGFTTVDDFGFEYSIIVEGRQATKRQVGSVPVIIRCSFYGRDSAAPS